MKNQHSKTRSKSITAFFSALIFSSLACNAILQTPAPASNPLSTPTTVEAPKDAEGFFKRGSDFKKVLALNNDSDWLKKAQDQLNKLGL